MNSFNQNPDVNEIFQNHNCIIESRNNNIINEKNDIVSSPSSGSSRSSSRSNSKQQPYKQEQEKNNLIKVYSNKSNHNSRSRTRSTSSNSTSKSNSRSPSSVHSLKNSLKNEEKMIEKHKNITKSEKNQNESYISDPRSRHFSPGHVYHHRHHHIDISKKQTTKEELKSNENEYFPDDINEKYKKRRSRTPENLYESDPRYNNSKKSFQQDYFINAAKAENLSKRDKNYESDDYSRKNEKTYKMEDYDNTHRHEAKEHDPYHRHHYDKRHEQIKQTRIYDKRPSSRDRSKNYAEEEDEERERYAGDYLSICLKNLNETLRADDLREHIYNEFKNYRNFSVKVVNNRKASSSHSSSSHNSEKIAFVNFSSHSDAKHAKKAKSSKLFFGYQLYIEPVFRNRSSVNDSNYSDEGSSVRSSSRRHNNNVTPPLRNHRRSFTPSPNFRANSFHDRSRSRTPPHTTNLKKSRNINTGDSRNHHLSFSRSRSQSPNKTSSQYHNHEKDKNRYFSGEPTKMNFPNENIRQDLVRNKKYLIERSISPKSKHDDYEEKRIQNKKFTSTKNDQAELSAKDQSSKNRSENLEIDKNETIERSDVETVKVNFSSKYLSNSDLQEGNLALENTNNKTDDRKVERLARNKSPIKNVYSRSKSFSPSDSKLDNKYFRSKHISDSNNNTENKKFKTNRRSPSIPRNNGRLSPKTDGANYGGVSHYFDNDERDATRTLFVGNLDNQIETKDLIPIFEKYGIVEEIDIKRNQPILPSYQLNNSDYFMNSNLSASKRKTYAFIKYFNMDMAIAAKYHLNGTKLGKFQTECKIGYGKVQSTNCLWVGGLTEKSKRSDLETEFEYFAMTTIQKSIAKASKQDILYKKLAEFNFRPNGELFAYILFPTISQAEEARNQMRGRRLPSNSSERLRIDYVDPKKFRQSRGRSHSRSPIIPNVSPKIYSRRSLETVHQSKNVNRYEETRDSNGHSSSRHRDQRSLTKLINDEKYMKFERNSRSRSPRKAKLEYNLSKNYNKDYRETVADRYMNKRSYAAIKSESTSPVFNKDADSIYQNDSKIRNTTGSSPTKNKILSHQSISSENTSEIFENKRNQHTSKLISLENQPSKESSTNMRVLKKNKTFESKALLGAKLENIIITKTDNSRQVNKLSDLINSNQNDYKKDKKLQDPKPLSPNENSNNNNNKNGNNNNNKNNNDDSEKLLKINSQPIEIENPSEEITKENDSEIQHSIENQVKSAEESKQEFVLKENQTQDLNNEIKTAAIESESKEEKNFKNDTIQELSTIQNLIAPSEKKCEKNESELSIDEETKKETIKNDEIINKKSSSLKVLADSFKLINAAHIDKNILNNNLKSIEQVSNLIEDTWSGVFTLKKHIFPTKFFLIAGCKEFAKQILPQHTTNKSSSYNCLRISQRLRLDDSKLDELEKKIYEMNHQTTSTKLDSSSFSLLISIPSDQLNELITENQYHQRSLHNLITYLDQKNAAGVIPLPDDDKPNSMMHAFTPNCVLSNKLLKQLFPHIKKAINTNNFVNSDFIVIVLFKQNSTTNASSANTN